ncbi:YesL family protein [Peribacillus sp. NPDC096379]|uniref:YesL family protein n=1 Tax=Peribacillus sp. NPDC096379 TaxID=3364393 RepID=UPI0037F6FF9A
MIGSSRLMNNVYVVCDWIIRLLYLNLLWIVFTIAGLVIAGIFPATVALFSVLKEWIHEGKNVRVFNVFLNIYRKEFLKANRLGIILFFISIVFYTDWLFTNQLSGTLGMITKGVLLGSGFVFGITLLYVVPVYLQVDGKVFTTIKLAFLIGIIYPHYTFIMMLSVASLMLISFLLPMAGFLFFASGLGCVLMFFSMHLIRKIGDRTKKIQKQGKSQLAIHN